MLAILPYEMQISSDAERVYAGHGIEWADDFIEGRTQEVLIESLDSSVEWVDLRDAFIDRERPAKARDSISVGEYFVYDEGDKLDWNHPNRLGHAKIAEYMARVDVLGRVRR